MPVMDGIAFLKQVRATDKNIPFIMFTGRGREEIAIEAFENGADFYLQKGGAPKPQFAELIHKIKAAVNRRQAESQVATLNRLYSVLSATNKAIVRIHDPSELLKEICRIVVDIGGFTMAWAGLVNPATRRLELAAASGHIESYFDTLSISVDDNPSGRGPTGTAFRQGTYKVCNDIGNDATMAPIRRMALERGYRSLAAFPFASGTRNAGVITFYSSEPGFFNDHIIRLLDEQSGDISFALRTLDNDELRKSAENELKSSELRYRRLFETAQDAILILDGDTGKVIDANKFIIDMLGYPIDYFVGKNLWELGFIRDKTVALKAFSELKTNGYVRYENIPLEKSDGRSFNVEFISNVYLVDTKRIIQCNIRDITDRKKVEDALALTVKKLALMSEITRDEMIHEHGVLSGSLGRALDLAAGPEAVTAIRRAQEAEDTIQRQITFIREYGEIGVKSPEWQRISDIARSTAATFITPDFSCEIPEDLPELFADPLLAKVFYHLFENSRQHGGAITRICMSTRETGPGLTIIVADNGAGVSPEEKQHIFERGSGKKFGHGLFLSRDILAITGISIRETGIPGKGARFEIAVPQGSFRPAGKPAPV
jgi:PAS domain S-box-containing protein